LTWRIEFDPAAFDDLAQLDRGVQRRILKVLRERIAPLEDPRSLGEALHGKEFGRFWKYRIGDYRVICDIQDKVIRILVLRIGHRREVYR
jgi:mRNA interferase RelE/StbE